MNNSAAMSRRLRGELRRLRLVGGRTQREVAEALEWSPSKVIRIENGQVGLSVTDLRALLAYYDVTDQAVVGELAKLARSSKPKLFGRYRGELPADTIKYFEYEAAASAIRSFELLVVPGLLQIESYTSTLLEVYGTPDGLREAIFATRHDRQHLLMQKQAPKAHFIVDEQALLRPVGGPAVMREQLQHLLAAAKRPNITIQVLPLARGAHVGLQGTFTILEFGDSDDADVLYLEGRAGADRTYVGEWTAADSHRKAFAALASMAEPPSAFASYVMQALASLDTSGGSPH